MIGFLGEEKKGDVGAHSFKRLIVLGTCWPGLFLKKKYPG